MQDTPVIGIPVFDADSAYSYVSRQVGFGYRVPNTPAHKETAAYLSSELARHGAEVQVQKGQVTAYDGTILDIYNIIGSYNADKKDRILLFAHWDTRPYADHDAEKENWRKPIAGANDGASGVGVLLEIARQMGKKVPETGVDIIFFDAEDYGTPEFWTGEDSEDTWALGTQYWIKQPHQTGYKARYGILLDMVGDSYAAFYKEQFSMHYAAGIVNHIWNTAKRIGYGKYFLNRDGGYITDDHVYVNKIGIPAVDIIHFDPNTSTGFPAQWHTVDDTMEHIDPATLKAVGQTVLTVVYEE